MSKKKRKKGLIIFLSVIFVIAAICIGFVTHIFNRFERISIEDGKIEINQEVEDKLSKYSDSVTNIALFGIDAEDGNIGRSDSIMIATVDSNNKVLKLTSIMRDSYVNIPGRGMDKINHAYAFGGPELAINTLNSNFDLNIKDYAAVNFSSLPKVIDLVGGVEIEITEEEVSHINGINSAGVYNLTGDQALAYSRIRYATGGDYKRTERQREVLEKVFEKVSSKGLGELTSLVYNVLPLIQTSLGTGEILDLGTEVLKIKSTKLTQERFPLDGYCNGEMINGIYYLVFDKDETVNQLHEYIFENRKIWLE